MNVFTVKLGTKNSDSEQKLFIKKRKHYLCECYSVHWKVNISSCFGEGYLQVLEDP